MIVNERQHSPVHPDSSGVGRLRQASCPSCGVGVERLVRQAACPSPFEGGRTGSGGVGGSSSSGPWRPQEEATVGSSGGPPLSSPGQCALPRSRPVAFSWKISQKHFQHLKSGRLWLRIKLKILLKSFVLIIGWNSVLKNLIHIVNLKALLDTILFLIPPTKWCSWTYEHNYHL